MSRAGLVLVCFWSWFLAGICFPASFPAESCIKRTFHFDLTQLTGRMSTTTAKAYRPNEADASRGRRPLALNALNNWLPSWLYGGSQLTPLAAQSFAPEGFDYNGKFSHEMQHTGTLDILGHCSGQIAGFMDFDPKKAAKIIHQNKLATNKVQREGYWFYIA